MLASNGRTPKVSQNPILFDCFVFSSLGGHINIDLEFLYGRRDFHSISSVSGLGLGIHTKEENLYIQMGVGYQYMPYAYAGQLRSNPIHTHWINVDLNQSHFLGNYSFFYGAQTSIRIKRELDFPLADQYVGITNDCFSKVAVALYVGWCLPILPNFILQIREGGYVISPINDKNLMRNMMSESARSYKIYFEGRLVYRFFTTGRKSRYIWKNVQSLF